MCYPNQELKLDILAMFEALYNIMGERYAALECFLGEKTPPSWAQWDAW